MLKRSLTALGGMALPGGEDSAAVRSFEQAAEAFFGAGEAVAFWKGRVGLYALLRALEIGPGDEVIVPGYTCVMVPGPVVYRGAIPVYADIDPVCYAPSAAEISRRITPKTRAILVQHTYGLPAPIQDIVSLAAGRGISIIEDCCHTFGGRLGGRFLGTFGAAAFFSGQWNKPFSTGLGGLALIHDRALAERVRSEQAGFSVPSRKKAFMLASQLLVYELLIYPRTTALATRTFRWLSRRGLVVGSSSNAEFTSALPPDYALRCAPVQARLGRQELERLAANLASRRAATAFYQAELPRLGYPALRLPPDCDAPLVRYPLRVANKAEALARSADFGVEIGSWFENPLHPSETDQRAFGYLDGMCPVSERVCREVINLPTHRRVSRKDLHRTLEFVQNVCRPADPAAP